MTEVLASPSVGFGSSAGAMMREARERQGMHIAMLAATMKVTPGKLEALEADRYEELPDLAFARALAKTVCRTLKIDADPVLARLPSLAKPVRLERTAVGLNTPFREGHAGHHPTPGWQMLKRPVLWATSLVLVGAAVLAFAPLDKLPFGSSRLAAGTGSSVASGTKPAAVVTEVVSNRPGVIAASPSGAAAAPTTTSAGTTAASAGSAGSTTSAASTSMPPVVKLPVPNDRGTTVGPQRGDATVIETVHDAPPTSTVSAGASGVLVVRARAEAWVDISDAKGRPLIARSLQPGETIGIDGEAPFRVRLGNAPQTDVRFRGEAVDLAPRSTGSTARFELK